jgi:hypothetical protein
MMVDTAGAGGPGFCFADTIDTVGAPSFAFFAKGGYHRTSAAAELGHSIAERNLGPAFIHAHRAGGPGFCFADTIDTVGAPSFAFFAKGGYPERLRRRSYATRLWNEILVQPSFTRTGPASSKR